MNDKYLIPKRGAMANLSFEVIREVSKEEILNRLSLGRPTTSPPPLQQLSARHRRQAQLLAIGHSAKFVADALGTTPARIYQLQQDPMFKQLVHDYSSGMEEKLLEDHERIQEKLLSVGESALDEMASRLEGNEPNMHISYEALRKTVELAADRTVAPPKTVDNRNNNLPANITLNFGTQLRRPETNVIDITPEKK